ncbi:MAG: type I glyceraldehyde-3-phosphate dehydrogenase [Victivallales bacterium]|jgi:glyceraldehyde 3-phosphate dehydrogenase
MINIAINGFGRIGRALARQILTSRDCRLVLVNELDPNVDNALYLLKYDSLYGRFPNQIDALKSDGAEFICNGTCFRFYTVPNSDDIPWESHQIDVLIDATGIKANVLAARRHIKRGVSKVVITHSPPEKDVDATIIMGVNDSSYDACKHNVLSSSICDASAIAPVLHELQKGWGVESCFATTLHPWLSYQNLLDGPVSSVSSPGHFWQDYALGRNSVLSLIPKDTTAADAVLKVMPELKDKLDAISFRVPTNIVSASDVTVMLKNNVSRQELLEHFKASSIARPDIFEVEEQSLVSIDFLGTSKSVIIDARRVKVLNERMVKMVLWYDNEWGYSSRVLDIARMVAGRKE